jgi:23S rRNA pseudouridine2604 synthase
MEKNTEKPAFPMRINKYLALKKHSTRRGADELIKKGQVFINGRLAVLGDKVQESDTIEVKFRGKPTPHMYFAYNKPKGIATHPEQGNEDEMGSHAVFPEGVFPVGGLDKDSRGLIIFTNDGRITERLLSVRYSHEKEYVVVTKGTLRASFKQKMEAGVKIGDEETAKGRVAILDNDRFRILLTDEKRHQVRRMCAALFQEVKDMECVRIMNIRLGTLEEGAQRKIAGDELKTFLGALRLL